MRAGGVLSKHMSRTFAVPTFVKTSSQSLPYVKLTGISGEVSTIEQEPIRTPLILAGFVNFVLKNVIDLTQQSVDMALPKRLIQPDSHD